VEVGDHVDLDQLVVEVETAKATVELPSPIKGVVKTLHGAPGDVIEVGAPLISFNVAEPLTVMQAVAQFDEPGVVLPTADSLESDASGNVLVGYGTSPAARRTRRRRAQSASDVATKRVSNRDRDRPTVLSPVVRKLASVRGVDLENVKGTGPGGLIVRRDVEAASADAESCRLDATPVGSGGVRSVPLSGIRLTAARRLTTSRREIPEATVWVDVDVTRLLEIRLNLNRDDTKSPVSLLGLISRFTVAALKHHPELNASYDADTNSLLYHDVINLGFAAQTPVGLLVPVIHGAGEMTARQLSEAVRDLTHTARDSQLPLSALTGGTCTVNNYGVFDVDGSAAIINHPEVAILGIGRIFKRPWVVDDAVVPRAITELTLSFDHRVCDGGTAASFLRFIRDCMSEPAVLVGEI
jgi:pyruvate dehydrogenase E2 component (dihydrolipoamide acetyltransferase)